MWTEESKPTTPWTERSILSFLLQENGDFLLQEDSDKVLLEESRNTFYTEEAVPVTTWTEV